MTDQEILVEIKGGNQRPLQKVYNTYHDGFIKFIRKKFGYGEEECRELYQVTMVTLYENIINGKLTDLTSTLKSYVFSIGKYKAMELHRGAKRNVWLTGLSDGFELEDSSVEERDAKIFLDARIEEVSEMLKQISDKCQELLRLFYFDNLSMTEIQERFSFKSAHVARNEKYKCIQALKRNAS